jgi:hypothetical protein
MLTGVTDPSIKTRFQDREQLRGPKVVDLLAFRVAGLPFFFF